MIHLVPGREYIIFVPAKAMLDMLDMNRFSRPLQYNGAKIVKVIGLDGLASLHVLDVTREETLDDDGQEAVERARRGIKSFGA